MNHRGNTPAPEGMYQHMIFRYSQDTEHGARSFRPDIRIMINKWLRAVPTEAWQYCQGFRVGPRGELVVEFLKAPAGSPPDAALRRITISVDSNATYVETDTHLWYDPYPSILSMRVLNRAADLH